MVKKNCGYKEGVFQISAVFQEYTNIYYIMRLHVAGQPAFFWEKNWKRRKNGYKIKKEVRLAEGWVVVFD